MTNFEDRDRSTGNTMNDNLSIQQKYASKSIPIPEELISEALHRNYRGSLPAEITGPGPFYNLDAYSMLSIDKTPANDSVAAVCLWACSLRDAMEVDENSDVKDWIEVLDHNTKSALYYLWTYHTDSEFVSWGMSGLVRHCPELAVERATEILTTAVRQDCFPVCIEILYGFDQEEAIRMAEKILEKIPKSSDALAFVKNPESYFCEEFSRLKEQTKEKSALTEEDLHAIKLIAKMLTADTVSDQVAALNELATNNSQTGVQKKYFLTAATNVASDEVRTLALLSLFKIDLGFSHKLAKTMLEDPSEKVRSQAKEILSGTDK